MITRTDPVIIGSLNLTLMLVLIQVVDANNRRKND